MNSSSSSPSAKSPKKKKGLHIISILFGDCLCTDAFRARECGESIFSTSKSQIIELGGIECISLGAVIEELSPRQRVDKTIQQLSTNIKRLISVGYIKEEHKCQNAKDLTLPVSSMEKEKVVKSIPLEVYEQNFPEEIDKSLSEKFHMIIEYLKCRQYKEPLLLLSEFVNDLKEDLQSDFNECLLGIMLHNMAVIKLLAGQSRDSISLFQEAVTVKSSAFGENSLEVAVTLDELGIQYFADGKYENALEVFKNAGQIRLKVLGSSSHEYAMVLNNIACVEFLVNNPKDALEMFQKARDIQLEVMKTHSTVGIHLLRAATTFCNMGYMKLRLRSYEEALSIFEEALLIQQSVLGDDHDTIRTTMYNIEFANGFHSL